MKKVLICLFLMGAITLSFSQDIESFRILSTGGALDGDLEYSLDPIDLQSLSGTRIYGGLSNFAGSDKLLSNQGPNPLVIGVSTDKAILSRLKASIILQYNQYQHPRIFQYLDDPTINSYSSSIGELERFWQIYRDSNGNGLYDNRITLDQKYKNLMTTESTELFAVLSMPWSAKSIWGYKFGYSAYESDNSAAQDNILDFSYNSPTTNEVITTTTLPDTDPSVPAYVVMQSRRGDFATTMKSKQISNELAYNRELSDWDISASYLLSFTDESAATKDSALREIELNGVVNDYHKASKDFEDSSEGMSHTFSLRSRRYFSRNQDLSKSAFATFRLSASWEKIESEFNNKTYEKRDYDSDSFDHIITLTESGSADIDGFILGGSVRFNLPLNARTYLGTGASYNYSKLENEGPFHKSYQENRVDYNSQDVIAHSSVLSYDYSGIRNDEVNTHILKVPFGIEYWFSGNQKWAFRAGSTFAHIVYDTINREKPTEVVPYTAVYTYPDGSTETYITDNTMASYRFRYRSSSSSTNMSYGLCFKPNPNLQIELISMFDQEDTELWNTSFFRSLRLAFSFQL